MNPEELAKADQALAVVSNTVPPFLWSLYQNSVGQGFTEAQAFTITLTYLKGMLPNASQGGKG
jgi:hypothetical protein